MKITVKEIGISGALIIASGLLIGAVSALCQKKSPIPNKTNKESKPKSASTPVVKMEVAFKSESIEKPIQAPDIVKVAPKEVILTGQTLSEEETPEIEETASEVDAVIPPDSIEEMTPKLAMMSDDFPLQLGSKGKRVCALQKYLLKHHGWGGELTDLYDQNLADRVQTLLKVEQVDKQLFSKLIHKRKRRR